MPKCRPMTRLAPLWALGLAFLLVGGSGAAGLAASRSEALTTLKQMGLLYTVEAFLTCAAQGNTRALELFLDAGINPNSKRKEDQSTALIEAAKAGHVQAVAVLLNRGAAINAQNPWGSALIAASNKGHLPVVEFLLSRGAEVNARAAEEGVTALTVAAFEGHTRVVKALLAKGAKVDVVAFDWEASPLILAAQEGHIEIVKLLVGQGANVNFRAGNEATVLEAASGHPEIVAFLKKSGAK